MSEQTIPVDGIENFLKYALNLVEEYKVYQKNRETLDQGKIKDVLKNYEITEESLKKFVPEKYRFLLDFSWEKGIDLIADYMKGKGKNRRVGEVAVDFAREFLKHVLF